jgi:hypothetical protein
MKLQLKIVGKYFGVPIFEIFSADPIWPHVVAATGGLGCRVAEKTS